MALDHEDFDPVAFFTGPVLAHGIFEDRFGRMRRRFRIAMFGRLQSADRLDLHESLSFDDGSSHERHLLVHRQSAQRFTMSGTDIAGTAMGEVRGGTAELRYVYNLPMDGKILAVRMRDRLYRINDGYAVNRASLFKFGIHLGDITGWFERT